MKEHRALPWVNPRDTSWTLDGLMSPSHHLLHVDFPHYRPHLISEHKCKSLEDLCFTSKSTVPTAIAHERSDHPKNCVMTPKIKQHGYCPLQPLYSQFYILSFLMHNLQNRLTSRRGAFRSRKDSNGLLSSPCILLAMDIDS